MERVVIILLLAIIILLVVYFVIRFDLLGASCEDECQSQFDNCKNRCGEDLGFDVCITRCARDNQECLTRCEQ